MTIDRDRLVRIFDELGQRLATPATICVVGSTPATWRGAVTKYHLKGWSRMTPERVDAVRQKAISRQRAPGVA
jgi:hypothetical protein